MKSTCLDSWKGNFGEGYLERNKAEKEIMSSVSILWSQIFRNIQHKMPHSILEVGCNLGINLRVLQNLSSAELFGLEPFSDALTLCLEDRILQKENAFNISGQEMHVFEDNKFDMTFTSGVLIHVNPEDLKCVTRNIVRVSSKYVVCIEYFSDKEEEIIYRGQSGLLFKRDFGSFYLDNYPELSLLDYGFAWKKTTGLDNLTWWLFEKK
jgi:pseudaminic acid biosynthesis-associated methylase